MTNAEAIKIIDQYDCNFYWTDGKKIPTKDLIEAFYLAVKALEAQEPRVLTLEEVKGMKRLTVCAVEQHSKVIKNTFNAEYGGIVTIGNENFLDFGLYGDTNRYRRSEAGYGKTWRCWTAKPTKEQREATPWEN